MPAYRASRGTLNAFGFGAVASGVKNHVFGGWVLVYYNQVLGLEPALAGLALALALVVDAVTDPLVGVWSDRARTRWGRRHPFMYAGILPFAVSFHALLQPPTDMSQSGLFVRLLCLAVAVRVSMTLYEIPRGALGPELTKDYDQRTQLIGWSTSYGWFGGAGFAWLTLAFLLPETAEYQGSRAYLNPAGYRDMAWIGGLIIFATGMISTLGLHRHIPALHVPEADAGVGFSPRKLGREIVETLSNRSWLMLFAAGLVFALYVGLHSNTDRYYDLYFWQWTPRARPDFSRCPYVHRHQLRTAGLSADARAGQEANRDRPVSAVGHAGAAAGRAAAARPPGVGATVSGQWQRRFMVAALAAQCVSGVAGGRWFYPGRLHDRGYR